MIKNKKTLNKINNSLLTLLVIILFLIAYSFISWQTTLYYNEEIEFKEKDIQIEKDNKET